MTAKKSYEGPVLWNGLWYPSFADFEKAVLAWIKAKEQQ